MHVVNVVNIIDKTVTAWCRICTPGTMRMNTALRVIVRCERRYLRPIALLSYFYLLYNLVLCFSEITVYVQRGNGRVQKVMFIAVIRYTQHQAQDLARLVNEMDT